MYRCIFEYGKFGAQSFLFKHNYSTRQLKRNTEVVSTNMLSLWISEFQRCLINKFSVTFQLSCTICFCQFTDIFFSVLVTHGIITCVITTSHSIHKTCLHAWHMGIGQASDILWKFQCSWPGLCCIRRGILIKKKREPTTHMNIIQRTFSGGSFGFSQKSCISS